MFPKVSPDKVITVEEFTRRIEDIFGSQEGKVVLARLREVSEYHVGCDDRLCRMGEGCPICTPAHCFWVVLQDFTQALKNF